MRLDEIFDHQIREYFPSGIVPPSLTTSDRLAADRALERALSDTALKAKIVKASYSKNIMHGISAIDLVIKSYPMFFGRMSKDKVEDVKVYLQTRLAKDFQELVPDAKKPDGVFGKAKKLGAEIMTAARLI